MTYKTKKIEPFPYEWWDGIPDNVIIHDHDSPAYMDLTDEEFNGFIKGINIISDNYLHLSADSDEFNSYCKEFKKLLPKDKTYIASWSSGILVGLREIPNDFMEDKTND